MVGTPALPYGTVPTDGSIVIRPRGESRQDAPAETAMIRIMQADGTMKMEPQYGNEKTVDTSSGNVRIRTGLSAVSKKDL